MNITRATMSLVMLCCLGLSSSASGHEEQIVREMYQKCVTTLDTYIQLTDQTESKMRRTQAALEETITVQEETIHACVAQIEECRAERW